MTIVGRCGIFVLAGMPFIIENVGVCFMQRIITLETRDMNQSLVDGGCGECQTSCQSACKTSCGVANQQCENPDVGAE